LIQRSLIEQGARFDPDFSVHEDHDFLVNCATRTEFRFVDMPTCIWHAQSGESGCGFGANDNPAQREQALAKIRRKWSRVFDLWFQDTEAVLYTGQQYLKGGDLPVALMCLEYALKSRPDDINALNLCGMANFRSGNTDRAEILLSEASRRLPEHRGLRENLALVRSKRTPTDRS
jgi:tetratricopeptide (TPR) repeat protein